MTEIIVMMSLKTISPSKSNSMSKSDFTMFHNHNYVVSKCLSSLCEKAEQAEGGLIEMAGEDKLLASENRQLQCAVREAITESRCIQCRVGSLSMWPGTFCRTTF